MAGLLLVVPVAVLLAVGAGGAEPSLLVLSPLVTFSLPVVAMIAFWWEDWPGTRLGPNWAGWADTVLVVLAAIALTVLGQAVVGHVSFAAIFDPSPEILELSTFPATMPIAGAAFVATLQLTLVTEGWPLRRYLKPIPAGACAVVLAWLIAIVLWVLLLGGNPFHGEGHGLLTGGQLGAVLTLVGLWQVWLFVVWRGFPFCRIRRQWVRLVSGNAVTIGGAILTYLALAQRVGVSTPTLSAVAGSFIAGGLIIGMLFEDALPARWSQAQERAVSLVLSLAVAAALHLILLALADSLHWGRGSAIDWVGHVTLNAIGLAVILHVAIGRRWPFARTG
ncbi:hypothetical protein AB0F91_45055 [Amycolatopsis sp. NPDC023774]|uniref:hypothetical protein n=1 Tax=Amycolatopsis sp. NPDC023774 TaxID=3155015 RepID=UPI0033C45CEF